MLSVLLYLKQQNHRLNKLILSQTQPRVTDYPGVDKWKDIMLKEGTEVVGGLPGQSEFYTTLKGLSRSGSTKKGYSQGLQVAPHPTHGYRSQVGVYKVTKDTPAAMGTTYANPQNGIGGLPQIFVPDYSPLQLVKTLNLK